MHYHAYTWTGDATEHRRRTLRESHIDHDRFAHSDLPPLKHCWWLRKPPHLVVDTWDMPWAAADWLAAQYHQVADQIAAPTIWTDERRTHAARDLAEGYDITWQWHLANGTRVFASAVACSPNAWDPDAPCPLGEWPH